MIVTAFLRALPQIALPGIRAVLWRTLWLTLIVFIVLGVTAWLGLHELIVENGWGRDGVSLAVGAIAALIVVLSSWLLFRAIAMAIVGLHADEIVAAVEKASYAERHASARVMPVKDGMAFATRSMLRAIGWNLAALPLYLILLVTGIGTSILFLIVNAYLLGRDLAELVEERHPDMPRFTAGQRWQIGLVSALLFLPPLVNLLAPVWSVAMAAHMFHGRRTD